MKINFKKCAIKALKNPCSLMKSEYYGSKTLYCDYIIYLKFLKGLIQQSCTRVGSCKFILAKGVEMY